MSEPTKGQENFSNTTVMNFCKLHSKEIEKAEALLVKAQELPLLNSNKTFLHKTDDCYKDLVCSGCLTLLYEGQNTQQQTSVLTCASFPTLYIARTFQHI